MKDELCNYRGVIDDFSKVIKINPEYASAYYNRGNAQQKLGDINGAKGKRMKEAFQAIYRNG